MIELTSPKTLAMVRPGPRYTSYPPANRFTSTFGAVDARAALERIPVTTPLSLYVHIPFCRSLCWYCACNVIVSRNPARAEGFVETVTRDMENLGRHLGTKRPVVEVALGGGSPNFLQPEALSRLTAALRANFDIAVDAELGVELDPRDTTREQVQTLARLGFSRFSVGVQDFAPEVQSLINRIQTPEQTANLIVEARSAGFSTANIDLVYGLPGQTLERFRKTLRRVLAIAPDRIALFGYAHLPEQRPHQKLVERDGPIPAIAERAQLLSAGLDMFAEAGYVRVGIDHFALPNDSLARASATGHLQRNFQGYAVKRSEVLLGIGPTAVSDTGDAYFQNDGELDTWKAAVDAGHLPVVRGVAVTAEDRLRRAVINELMCYGTVRFSDIESRFPGIQFERHFPVELLRLGSDEMQSLVMVKTEARAIETTPLGAVLARNVAMVFDPEFIELPSASSKPKHAPSL
jgi:oxygen-independent coproporphyrinogen III oxidase